MNKILETLWLAVWYAARFVVRPVENLFKTKEEPPVDIEAAAKKIDLKYCRQHDIVYATKCFVCHFNE